MLFACGDSASEECDLLVDRVCDRALGCGATANRDSCRSTIEDGFEGNNTCDDADGVSDQFDPCLTDLDSASCLALFGDGGTLPSTCISVILFE